MLESRPGFFLAHPVCSIVSYRVVSLIQTPSRALADLGFFRGGDFGNPGERSERALKDLARGGAQNDIEIT